MGDEQRVRVVLNFGPVMLTVDEHGTITDADTMGRYWGVVGKPLDDVRRMIEGRGRIEPAD